MDVAYSRLTGLVCSVIVQLVAHEEGECILCCDKWQCALPKQLWRGLAVIHIIVIAIK